MTAIIAIRAREILDSRGNPCQSALEWDPLSASKRDPFDRRVLMVALAASELAGVVETARARVVVDRHHRANSVRCRGRHFEQREVVAQHPRDRSTGRKPDRPKPCRGSPHAFSDCGIADAPLATDNHRDTLLIVEQPAEPDHSCRRTAASGVTGTAGSLRSRNRK